MSAISALIDAALAHAVAANPKLFDPKKVDRAAEILARDATKFLTRPAKEGEAEAQAETETPSIELAPLESQLGKAYRNLRGVAGCIAPPHMSAAGVYVPRAANNAAVLAFAAVPTEWRPVTKAQQTAWFEFFERTLNGANRRPIGDTTPLPWPWPPSKEGRTYDADIQEELPAP